MLCRQEDFVKRLRCVWGGGSVVATVCHDDRYHQNKDYENNDSIKVSDEPSPTAVLLQERQDSGLQRGLFVLYLIRF